MLWSKSAVVGLFGCMGKFSQMHSSILFFENVLTLIGMEAFLRPVLEFFLLASFNISTRSLLHFEKKFYFEWKVTEIMWSLIRKAPDFGNNREKGQWREWSNETKPEKYLSSKKNPRSKQRAPFKLLSDEWSRIAPRKGRPFQMFYKLSLLFKAGIFQGTL